MTNSARLNRFRDWLLYASREDLIEYILDHVIGVKVDGY